MTEENVTIENPPAASKDGAAAVKDLARVTARKARGDQRAILLIGVLSLFMGGVKVYGFVVSGGAADLFDAVVWALLAAWAYHWMGMKRLQAERLESISEVL